ncbi:MAG: hypothetical protein V3U96_05930 [Paracoccaceae bacterium]
MLAGCDGAGMALFQPVTKSVQLAGGNVTIAGPAGYCVDRSATRSNRDGGFALLGSCASLANDARVGAPSNAGALTASVSSETGIDLAASTGVLGRFFASAAGRAALARNGDAASVQVLSSQRSQGVFMIRVRDTSPNRDSGLAQDYWRAVFDVRGRIVTLSVNAFQGRPMSNAVGRATLAEFVARVRRENPPLVDPTADPV